MVVNATRLPAIFVNHGGGPMPLLGHPSQASVTAHLKGLQGSLPVKPKAILIATAHWEAPTIRVSTHPSPPMLYDYYGFPDEAYKLQYKAPGSPQLARRALELLRAAGLPAEEDSKRGFDHGTFVPLMLAFPDGDVPVVQMSLASSLDPALHVAAGRALAPLRDEGVLVLGSGSSFHNMRVFMANMGGDGGSLGGLFGKPKVHGPSKSFDDWLVESVTKYTGKERAARLAAWSDAPGGRESHPREEHLAPLFVVAGAGFDDPGRADGRGIMAGAAMSGFVFDA